MAESLESRDTQQIPGATPPNGGDGSAETVTISKKEWEETKHIAEVSSQNFERLKKSDEKIAELEGQIAVLQANPVPSDTDNATVKKLEADIADIKAKEAKRDVIERYPVLKDLWGDLESFRQLDENKGMNLVTAAKSFLIEKGLLEGEPRKGLERPTGGDPTPQIQGMSVGEAENLRKTDFKKYREMLKTGKLKVNYNS